MTRILRGLAAATLLALLLIGVPWALLVIGAAPPPPGQWSLTALIEGFTRPDDGSLLLTILTLAAWAGWAVFALTVLVELASQLGGIRAPSLPGLSVPQTGARILVSAVLGMSVLSGTAAHATPVATAPVATAPVATAPVATAPAAVQTPQVTPAPAVAQQLLNHATEAIAVGQQITLPTTATEAGTTQARQQPTQAVVEVVAGDTLWDLAAQHLGDPTRWPELADANPHLISDPDLIEIGWDLTLPTTASQDQAAEADQPQTPAQQEPAAQAEPAPVDLAPAATHAAGLGATLGTTAPAQTSTVPSTAPTAQDAAEQDPEVAQAPASPAPAREARPGAATTSLTPLPAAAPTPQDTTGEDLVAEQDRPDLTNWAGIASLSAAGLLGLLAARRAAQARRRRSGRRIAMPTGPAADLETTLRTSSDPLAVDDLDRALRSLTAWAQHTSTALPAIRAARITHDELELYLADDQTTLPSPFTAAEDAGTFVLGRDGIATLLPEEDLASIPAPCPALVTLGQDTLGGWVLVNLEEIGSLSIAAPEQDQHAIIAALALELVGSSWADDLRLTLVGALPELADVLGSDRIEHVDDLDRVMAAVLHASDVHARTLVAAGQTSAAAARGADVAAETWTPHLLILGAEPTERQRADLAELLATTPRLAVATITTSPQPLTDWVLHVQGQHAQLHPGEVDLTPQRVDADQYQAVIDAFATTYADDTDGPQWTHTLATEVEWETLPQPHQPPQDTDDITQPVTTDPALITATDPAAALLSGPVLSTVPDDEDDQVDLVETSEEEQEQPADLEDDQELTAAEQPPAEQDAELEEATDLQAETETTPQELDVDEDPAQLSSDQDVDGEPSETAPENTDVATGSGAGVEPAPPMVRLLGPVEVQRARGKRPQSWGRATELLAFLALHPSATHEPLDAAMWPGKRMDATKRNSPVSQVRRWLGTDTEGRPYVALVDEDGYRLRGVATDWAHFQDLLADDISAVPTLTLKAALSLVAGQPLSGVNPRYYAWAEADRQEMIAAVADVAHELSTRALASGDPTQAAWAAAKGLLAEPVSELLWRDQLRAAYLSGTPGKVEQVARQLTDTLEPIGGDMDPETIELLEQLLTTPTRHHA